MENGCYDSTESVRREKVIVRFLLKGMSMGQPWQEMVNLHQNENFKLEEIFAVYLRYLIEVHGHTRFRALIRLENQLPYLAGHLNIKKIERAIVSVSEADSPYNFISYQEQGFEPAI